MKSKIAKITLVLIAILSLYYPVVRAFFLAVLCAMVLIVIYAAAFIALTLIVQFTRSRS